MLSVRLRLHALLAVFVKVFDETCGYYGKQGHIPQFERDLDSRGLYENFKTAYHVIPERIRIKDGNKRFWSRKASQKLMPK